MPAQEGPVGRQAVGIGRPNGAGVNTRILAFINSASVRNLIAGKQDYTDAVDRVRTMCVVGGKLVLRQGFSSLGFAHLHGGGNNLTQQDDDDLKIVSTLMILSDYAPGNCPPAVPQKWAYKLIRFREQIPIGNNEIYPRFFIRNAQRGINGQQSNFMNSIQNSYQPRGVGINGTHFSYTQDLFAYKEARHGAFALFGRNNLGEANAVAAQVSRNGAANLGQRTNRSLVWIRPGNGDIDFDTIGAGSIFGREIVQHALRARAIMGLAVGADLANQAVAPNNQWGKGGIRNIFGPNAGSVPANFIRDPLEYKTSMQHIHDECEAIYASLRTDDTDQRLYFYGIIKHIR